MLLFLVTIFQETLYNKVESPVDNIYLLISYIKAVPTSSLFSIMHSLHTNTMMTSVSHCQPKDNPF